MFETFNMCAVPGYEVPADVTHHFSSQNLNVLSHDDETHRPGDEERIALCSEPPGPYEHAVHVQFSPIGQLGSRILSSSTSRNSGASPCGCLQQSPNSQLWQLCDVRDADTA